MPRIVESANEVINSLEWIAVILPLPAHLDLDLHALVDVLGPALVIHAELEQIAVLQLVRPRLVVRGREADVVQEGATARLRVPNEKLASSLAPDLGMRPRDDLALERELVLRRCVGSSEPNPRAVCETADTQRRIALSHIARYGVEAEGPARIKMGNEANAVTRPCASRQARGA